MRTTVPKGHTEALGRANNDAGAEFARWLQLREGQQIRGANCQNLGVVCLLEEIAVVVHSTIRVGVLDTDTAELIKVVQLLEFTDDQIGAQTNSTGFGNLRKVSE